MNYSRVINTVFLIITIFILALSAGCSGGSSGSDDDQDKGSAEEIEEALEAKIASPYGNTSINQGESVNFQGSVKGGKSPYIFSWKFSGAAPESSVEDPGSVTFSQSMVYTVIFTVIDSKGTTVGDTVNVTVNKPPADTDPVATITSPIGGMPVHVGQALSFKGSVSGGNAPFTYHWDFGNGAENSKEANPADVVFNTAGTYPVTFSVTDADGDKSSSTIQVIVNNQALSTWYRDADNDGYGDARSTTQAASQPAGYVSDNSDCNDGNALINPGIADIPDNNVDENCDGKDLKTWYRDADVDEYGNHASPMTANTQPSGYVADNSDCNDSSASVHPGASEVCGDGIDQDCNGTDPACSYLWYQDSDGDDYSSGISLTAATRPGLDYYLSSELLACSGDLDDHDPGVCPGAPEICGDGKDNDCDGGADEGCDGSNGSVAFDSPLLYLYNMEFDCEGAEYDTEDQTNPPHWKIATAGGYMEFSFMDPMDFFFHAVGWTYLGLSECNIDIYVNGIKLFSNLLLDRNWIWYTISASQFVSGTNTVRIVLLGDHCFWVDRINVSTSLKIWYRDADLDGYGVPTPTVQALTQPAGYAANSSDCNDANPGIHPDATDTVGNGIDENCDGYDSRIWYRDADIDGYGNPAVSTTANRRPSGYVANNSDCNDGSSGIHPGAAEICNDGIDQDCNGSDLAVSPAVTIRVPADYATIQAAVDAANEGDTILVSDGTYPENVDVNKRVSISSVNGSGATTVVAADANDHVFEVLADYVTIDGFTVYGATAGASYPQSAGIYLSGSTEYCTIINNRCGYDSGHRSVCGLNIDGADYNVVENNVVMANSTTGIYLGSFSGGNRISGNTSSGNTHGIYLAAPLGDVNIISRNVFSENTHGIYADNANGCFVYLNTLTDNTWHNVYAYGTSCTWHSPEQMTYSFNGSTHTGYLGNYYGDYVPVTGGNDNGYGIGSVPYIVDTTNSAADQYPLWQAPEEYELTLWYLDADGDGYSNGMILVSSDRPAPDYYPASELIATTGDIYDDDPASYPGADEICGDGKDNDYNGIEDEGCGDGGRVVLNSATPQLERMGFDYLGAQYDTYYIDPLHWVINYIDGYMDFTFIDPADFSFHAGGSTYLGESLTNVDVYINGVRRLVNQFIEKAWNWYTIAASEFVSGMNTVRIMLTGQTNLWIDEANVSTTLKVWFEDADHDGFGNIYASTQAAVQPSGYVANSADCDDDDADVHPGAAEVADNWIDDNCDGIVDSTFFADNFEHQNPLGRWIVGGRRAEGVNLANTVQRGGSTRAHLYKESFTEVTLTPVSSPFVYSDGLVFDFDMEARVYSSGGAPSNYYCKSGVDFEFRNSEGATIGRVSYLAASTSYPFAQAASDSPNRTAATQIAQNVNTHYSLPVSELLSQIDINEAEIASIAMCFTTYSSTRPIPNIQAELWIDNVRVGSDSPPVVVPDITGMSFREAAASLGSAGLTAGTVTYEYNPAVLPYETVSQVPDAGSMAESGEPVDFIVSLGEVDPDAIVRQFGTTVNTTGNRYAMWDMNMDYPMSVGTINGGTSQSVLPGPSQSYLTSWTGPLTSLSPCTGEIVRVEEAHYTVQFSVNGTIRTSSSTENISGTGSLDYLFVTIRGGVYDGYFMSKGIYELPNGYSGSMFAAGADTSQWWGACLGDLNGVYRRTGVQDSLMLTSKQGAPASGTITCVWEQPVTVYTRTFKEVDVLTCDLRWLGNFSGQSSGTYDQSGSIVFLPMYNSGFYLGAGTYAPNDHFTSYCFLQENPVNDPYAAIVQPSRDITIVRGCTMEFYGSAIGNSWPFVYEWDFNGDGVVDSTVKDPGAYIFNTSGTYRVSFTVTDRNGLHHTDTITVEVQ